jgi:hypothetical protein
MKRTAKIAHLLRVLQKVKLKLTVQQGVNCYGGGAYSPLRRQSRMGRAAMTKVRVAGFCYDLYWAFANSPRKTANGPLQLR